MNQSEMQLRFKNLIYQIFKFGVVGVICFVIDYACLYILAFAFDYLIAAAIAYLISTSFNFLLSIKFVFKSKGDSKIKEAAIFVCLSLVGLGMTEICMYSMTEIIGFHYMLSKVFSTAIIMVFNFVTRKIFIEKKGDNNVG